MSIKLKENIEGVDRIDIFETQDDLDKVFSNLSVVVSAQTAYYPRLYKGYQDGQCIILATTLKLLRTFVDSDTSQGEIRDYIIKNIFPGSTPRPEGRPPRSWVLENLSNDKNVAFQFQIGVRIGDSVLIEREEELLRVIVSAYSEDKSNVLLFIDPQKVGTFYALKLNEESETYELIESPLSEVVKEVQEELQKLKEDLKQIDGGTSKTIL